MIVSCSHSSVWARDLDIRFQADSETFPRFVAQKIETAPLPAREQDRCLYILNLEAKKYPTELLNQVLQRVYVLSELTADGTAVGGLNYRSVGTICIRASGSTDAYLARLFHHEIVHLLLTDRTHRFPYRTLFEINGPDFHYGGGGLEAIKAGVTMNDGDESIRQSGFARPYGKSAAQEDLACIGEMLLSGDDDWWAAVDRYPNLRRKTELLVNYLSSIEPSFTLDSFRLMPQAPYCGRPPRYREGELIFFENGGKIVAPSNPRRIISVPAGACALFPERSTVHFDTPDTTVIVPTTVLCDKPTDLQVGNQTLLHPAPNGCWMVLTDVQGKRMYCRPGERAFFQCGGTIYKPDRDKPAGIDAGRFETYAPGSVVVFNPHLRQE
jgi:hypothetical protein